MTDEQDNDASKAESANTAAASGPETSDAASGQAQTAAAPQPAAGPTGAEAAESIRATGATTVQNALSVLDAAAAQREAVAKAYEAQKLAVKEAVEAQRIAAMQQLAEARRVMSASEADQQMNAARQATATFSDIARKTIGRTSSPSEGDAATKPLSTFATAAVPTTQTAAPSASSAPAVPSSGEGEKLSDEELAALANVLMAQGADGQAHVTSKAIMSDLDAGVMKEIALTLKTFISQEVERQLNDLVQAVTGGKANDEAEKKDQ